MTERDLTIRAKAETAEAKAQVDDLKESVKQLGDTAAAPSGEGFKDYGAALEAVKGGLERATQAVTTFAVASKNGTAEASGATKGLADAVGALEAIFGRVKAAGLGAAIPPEAVAQLADYKQALGGAATELGKTGEAAEKAGSKIAEVTTKAIAGSAGMGGFARVLTSLGGAAGTVLLPLLLLPAAIDLIIKGLTIFNEKSKDAATALVGWVLGLKEGDIAARKAGESYELYSTRLKTIVDRSDDVTRAQIAMGAGLIKETSDLDAARIAWLSHQEAMHGNAGEYPVLTKAMEALGFKFAETHEKMAANAVLFSNHYAAALKESAAAANAWAELNKGMLQKILNDYAVAGTAVPANLAKIAASLDLVSSAQKKLAEDKSLHSAFIENQNAAALLVAEIQRVTTATGSEGVAVKLLASSIESTVAALEKEKTATAADEAVRLTSIKTLTDLAQKHGLLLDAMGKVAAAGDKAIAVWKAEQAALAAADAEYAKHAATIAAAADKTIESIQKEGQAVQAQLAAEIAAVKAKYADGLISASQYFSALNALSAAQSKAANAAAAEEKAARDKANEELEKAAEKREKVADRIVKAQDAEAKGAEAAAAKIQKSIARQIEDLENLELAWVAAAEKAAEAGQSFTVGIPKASEMLHDLTVTTGELSSTLDTLAQKARLAFGGSSSGGGGGGGF